MKFKVLAALVAGALSLCWFATSDSEKVAYAQNYICPTQAVGDSETLCASTQFVQQNLQSTTNLSASIDAAFGSTRGSILERGASGWQIVTPGTSGLPWVSNGTGADPGYQALSGGGIAPNTVANSNLANMAAGTLKCRETGNGTGAPQDCSNPNVFVTDAPYNADPTGVSDSTAGINSCLALGNTTCWMVPGTYKTTSKLIIGNGNTTSTSSTINGIRLACAAGTRYGLTGTSGAPTVGPCNVQAAFNGTAIEVDGPIVGWGVSGVSITFGSVSGSTNGLVTFSASYGTVENFFVNNVGGFGILETVANGGPTGEFNSWKNIGCWMPAAATTAQCIQISSSSATNGIFGDSWDNINIIPNVSTQFGLHLGLVDSVVFNRLTVEPVSGVTSVLFDYSSNSSFPSAVAFINPDIGTGGNWTNNGTPAAGIGPNYIIGLNTTNNGTVPNLANLSVLAPGSIVMSPNGNAPNGVFGVDGVGHFGYHGTAPTPVQASCGVSGATASGNDNVIKAQSGTTAATSCVVNFAHTWTAAPVCVASTSSGGGQTIQQVSATTTQLTVTWSISAATTFWQAICNAIN